MIERKQRFVMLVLISILFGIFLLKGYRTSPYEGTVAFSHFTTSAVTIRLQGDVSMPGIYKVPVNSSVFTVIKMTDPDLLYKIVDANLLDRLVKNGDILDIVTNNRQHTGIHMNIMKAREKITLGLPLNVNSMSQEDWENLPGIGPSLAREIIWERQNNGDYVAIQDLARVPGIGYGKINKIIPYFK